MLLIRRAGGQTEPDLEVLLREDLHYLDECVALGRVERNAEKQVILRRGPTQPGAEKGRLGKPCFQKVHHDLRMPAPRMDIGSDGGRHRTVLQVAVKDLGIRLIGRLEGGCCSEGLKEGRERPWEHLVELDRTGEQWVSIPPVHQPRTQVLVALFR